MQSLRIKRWSERSADANAKADLRAYVDQLPIDQQRAFVAMATQLMDARRDNRPVQHKANSYPAMCELQC